MTARKSHPDPFYHREATKYTHPVPSREYILQILREGKGGYSVKKLLSIFVLETVFEKEAFRRRLRAMERDGQITKTRQGQYSVSTGMTLVRGHVLGHEDGFGFVVPQDGTSQILLTPKDMHKVLDGDFVSVRIVSLDRQNRRKGQLVEVLKRRSSRIVGRFFTEGGVGFVVPINRRMPHHIIIPDEKRGDAQPGQIVLAEIEVWPTKYSGAVGSVFDVLGDHMAPGLETEMIVHAHAIPHHWTDAVLQELKAVPEWVSETDKQKRVDLTDIPFVTIDGEDAQDFDDAVYCEKKPKGGWRLMVAIADVASYVRGHTALDAEARERGNSVYFPGRVIPMLPHVLSNGICSLKPYVDRLALVCDIALTEQGEIARYRFYSAVICSHGRLTYTQVWNFLSGKEVPSEPPYVNLLPHIQNLHALYTQLHQRRAERGALTFETKEVRVEFGPNKKIKRLVPIFRNDAHRLIEECMIVANICAARFLLGKKLPALFRIHDGPKRPKITALREFLGELGLTLSGGELPATKDYAALLSATQGRPDAHLIQTVLLRSLTQATYSADNADGHFGLALQAYTHFTSPIRRYSDLIVHRIIRAEIERRKTREDLLDFEALQVLGDHCSMTERRADEATREALDWLKCEYMLDKVGQQFDAVVSGVTGFGIFVELGGIFVEALVHISALEDDYYDFDATRHRLIGKATRKSYRIGDKLKVQVVRVNLDSRHIDCILV